MNFKDSVDQTEELKCFQEFKTWIASLTKPWDKKHCIDMVIHGIPTLVTCTFGQNRYWVELSVAGSMIEQRSNITNIEELHYQCEELKEHHEKVISEEDLIFLVFERCFDPYLDRRSDFGPSTDGLAFKNPFKQQREARFLGSILDSYPDMGAVVKRL